MTQIQKYDQISQVHVCMQCSSIRLAAVRAADSVETIQETNKYECVYSLCLFCLTEDESAQSGKKRECHSEKTSDMVLHNGE